MKTVFEKYLRKPNCMKTSFEISLRTCKSSCMKTVFEKSLPKPNCMKTVFQKHIDARMTQNDKHYYITMFL